MRAVLGFVWGPSVVVKQHSALVLVHSPDGAGEGVEHARDFFSERGFEVGPLVGISFSIAGSSERMESQFADFEPQSGQERELSLDGLPPQVRKAVRTVTTEAPPAFGPGNP